MTASYGASPGSKWAYVAQEPDFALDRDVFATVPMALATPRASLPNTTNARWPPVTTRPHWRASNTCGRVGSQQRLDPASQVEQVIDRLRLDGTAKVSSLSGGGISESPWRARWLASLICCCWMSRQITSISTPSPGWKS